MSNDAILILAPAASVANNIATSQKPSGAGNLTLNGSTVLAGPALFQGQNYTNYALLDIARRIQISDSGSSDGSVVFTLYGLNRDLQVASETITGVTATAPGISFYDYLIITSVHVSAATAGNITVGTVTAVNATAGVVPVASSAWVLVNPYASSWQLSAAVNPTGTALGATTGTFSLEHTYDDPNKIISPPVGGFVEAYGSQVPPVVFVSGANGKTAAFEYQYAANPIQAHRVTIYAGTTTGWAGGSTVTFWSLQGGIVS